MNERRIIGDFGFRVDVYESRPPKTRIEKLFGCSHFERVNVIGGMMQKYEAKERARVGNERKDGKIYRAVREIPPDFII